MVVGFSNNAMAQNTATVSNDAFATIIAPITIAKGQALNFGAIIKGAGTVILSTEGVRTNDYSAFAGEAAGNQSGTVTAGTFDVTGENNYTYAITLPGDVILTEVIDGTATMTVNAFNCKTATDADAGLDGTLNSSGADVITVGAKLAVSATQASGVYSGTFDVTVAYN
ncbi:MAG: hypothetical protein COB81_00350 [Flavobacteriaceae bacterium]|nr:MAG: hypothetical protein COB81_00350 [Flavobacteriaceae bacterium]